MRLKLQVLLVFICAAIATPLPAQRVIKESLAQWQSAQRLALAIERRWCTNVDAAGCEFKEIAEVVALPDGGIVAMNLSGPMHRFRQDGGFVGELARKGRGPGEFRFISSPMLVQSGELAWFDQAQQRIATIGLDGKPGPVKTLRLPQPVALVGLVEGELVVLEVPPSQKTGDTVTGVYRTVPSAGASSVLASVRMPSRFVPGSPLQTLPPAFTPFTVAAIGSRGDIAHSNGGRYLVEVTPATGLPWRLDVALPARVVSPADKDSLVAQTLRDAGVARFADLSDMLRGMIENAGKTVPPLKEIRVLRDGSIWIQLAAVVTAKTSRWDVFHRDGQRVGFAVLPVSASVRDGNAGWILTVERSDDDVPIVVRYKFTP